MKIDILLLNAIVYVMTLVFAWIRIKKINLYILLWIAYSLVALCGYYCVVSDLHYSNDVELGYKVNITPYIFAYITNLLITSPFYNVDVKRIKVAHVLDIGIFQQIATFMSLIFTIKLVTSIIIIIVIVSTIGMGNAYLMIHEGESVLEPYPLLAKISWITGIIIPVLKPFYVIYYIQRLIYKRGKVFRNIVFLSIAFLPDFITDISMGSKGGLFFSAFGLLFYYILFREDIPIKVNRIILKIGIVVAALLIVNTFLITNSRIEANTINNEETSTEHIVRYMGEAFPNLGWEFYGHVKSNPNGARFFPEFFGGQKYSFQDAKFDYWSPKTGVNMAIFKTFWGDWYVEFGFWGSFIAIFILFILSKIIIFNNYWKLSKIPLMSFYFLYITIYGCFVGSGIEGVQRHQTFLLLIVFGYIISNVERKYYSRIDKTRL